MYNLAPRDISLESTAGRQIGPNTYVICSSLQPGKKNFVPFLSSQIRASSFIDSIATDALYNVANITTSRIKGGATPRNRSKRFVYDVDGTPDPTRYTVQLPKCKKSPKLDPTKPKLYACKVAYTTTINAPSIPTKRDENGYDLGLRGELIKVSEDSPEFCFTQARNAFASGDLYKGCKWSRRTGRRFDVKEEENPSPGRYELQVPKCRRSAEDEEFREMARLFSFAPRYIEAEELKTKREGLPGPGSYNLSDRPPVKMQSVTPKPFISASRRFAIAVPGTPPPDRYNICDCSTKHKQFSTKCPPFGCNSDRFSRKKIDKSPGPAAYKLESPLIEKVKSKRNEFALFRPAFNKTATRLVGFAPRDAACTPSPADYPVETETVDGEVEEATVFISAARRFPRTKEKKDLGPASYNVSAAFNKNSNRKCHNTGSVPFNSSGPRQRSLAGSSGGPGPSDYGVACRLNLDSGYRFGTSSRFRSSCEDLPGPGHYELHPSIEKSVYPAFATHNLRLKENVTKKKLRLAPRETRKRWTTLMTKKKTLKWFHNENGLEEIYWMKIQKLLDQE